MNISNPKLVSSAVFIGVCAYQTHSDYKNASEKNKKKVLLRNAAVLTSALSGVFITRKAMSSFLKPKLIDGLFNLFKKIPVPAVLKPDKSSKLLKISKPLTTTAKKTGNAIKTGLISVESIAKETLEEFLVSLGGIIGAVATSNFIHKKIKTNTDSTQNNINNLYNNPVYNKFSANYNFIENPENGLDAATKIFGELGMPTVNAISTPLSTLSGLSISRQKGFENQFKQASYELIANAAVPTFVFSTVARATKNRSKTTKCIIYPLSLFTGLFAGHRAGLWFNKKITNEIIEEIHKNKQGNNPTTLKDFAVSVKKELL